MYLVYFFEDKKIIINQLLMHIPSVGEDITIKGRKGKVSSVNRIDEKNIHVQFILEKVKSNKKIVNAIKKKR